MKNNWWLIINPTLTQIALHGAGVVRGGVQRHDRGVQPGGAAPVHQLPAANQGLVLVIYGPITAQYC